MQESEREAVRTTIKATIDRLRASSIGANQMGARYARLLELLWRKFPKRNGQNTLHRQSIDNRIASAVQTMKYEGDPATAPPVYDPGLNTTYQQMAAPAPPPTQYLDPGLAEQYPDAGMRIGNDNGSGSANANSGGGPAFSWLDLQGTFNFALQNGTGSGSNSGEEGGPLGIGGFSPVDDEMGIGQGRFMDTSFLGMPDGTQFQF